MNLNRGWMVGLIALALCASPHVRGSDADSAQARRATQEIEGLLQHLGDSGCEFYRNGDWHDAAAAQAHLRRKSEHYLKRSDSPSADDFILRAASESSMSGEAYQVRCTGQPVQASAAWFSDALRALRDVAR